MTNHLLQSRALVLLGIFKVGGFPPSYSASLLRPVLDGQALAISGYHTLILLPTGKPAASGRALEDVRIHVGSLEPT
jgi:hypothetical protein